MLTPERVEGITSVDDEENLDSSPAATKTTHCGS